MPTRATDGGGGTTEDKDKRPSQRLIEAKRGGSPAPSTAPAPPNTRPTTQPATAPSVDIRPSRSRGRSSVSNTAAGVDESGVFMTPHRAKTLGVSAGRRQLIQDPQAPVVQSQVATLLSERAKAIDPQLAQKAPGLAAELMLSRHPTADLREVSTALFEAHAWKQGRTTTSEGTPGGLQPYYDAAAKITDPQERTNTLKTLDAIRELPEGERAEILAGIESGTLTDERLNEILGENVTTAGVSEDPGGVFGTLARWAGNVFGAVGGAVTWVGSATLQALGVDKLHADEIVHGAADIGQYGLRAVEGVGGFALAEVTGNAGTINNGVETGIWEEFRDYVPSWGEYKAGQHSGLTKAIFQLDGSNPDDSPGLAALMDIGADLVTGEVLAAAFADIKASRSATETGGGSWSTSEWLKRSPGKKSLTEIVNTIERVGPDESARLSALYGRFKSINPELAYELARTDGSRAAVARVLEESIESIPARALREANAVLRKVKAELATTAEKPRTNPAVPPEVTTAIEGAAKGPLGTRAPVTDSAMRSLLDDGVAQHQFDRLQGDPKLVDRGDGVYSYHNESTGAREYYKVDAEGKVVGFRQVDPTGEVGTAADHAASKANAVETGRTIGDELLDAHWDDIGVRGPEDIIREVSKQSLSEDAVRLNKRAAERRLNPNPDRPLVPDEAGRAKVEALLAEKAALEQHIIDLSRREPVFEFPTFSRTRAFMRGEILGEGLGGWAARALNHWFGETGRFDLSKFTDDFSPKERVLWDPAAGDTPTDWATRNAEALRKEMNVAKVPKETQRIILDEMMKVTWRQDAVHWRNMLADAFREGLTRGGKRTLPPELMDEALRWSKNDPIEAMRAPLQVTHRTVDGRTVTETRNVLEGPNGEPLPSRPTQFAGHFMLPDFALLQKLASTVNYLDHKLASAPVYGKIWGTAHVPWDVAKFVTLTLPRLVLKPALLLSRIVPMAMKIQIDQGLRMKLLGMNPFRAAWRDKGVDYTAAGIPANPTLMDLLPLDRFGNPDVTILGTVAEEIFQAGETRPAMVPTRNLTPMRGDPAMAKVVDEVLNSQYQHIVDLSTDPLTKMIAERGAEATRDYILTHPDSALGRWYEQGGGRAMHEYAGRTMDEWLMDLDEEINQAVGYNPALRDAISTKKWTVDSKAEGGAGIEVANREHEIRLIREKIATTTDAAELRSLNLQAEFVEHKLARAREVAAKTDRTVSLEDGRAMQDAIAEHWDQGDYLMPDEVKVQQRIATRQKDISPAEMAKEYARRVNNVLYKGLRPLAELDMRLTRGSTYRQVLDEVYPRLLDRGYAAPEAFRIAQQRAAYIARDLHYDITARSSFDRAMKDTLWFAPVVREQLTTYLYKIPAKSYWPVGILLRAGEVKSVIDGLKAFGLLHDEPQVWVDQDGVEHHESQVVARLPWISDFISKLFNNTEAGNFRIESLNPITPGGTSLIPTLAPGAEAILDLSAKVAPPEMLPLIEFLGQNLEFDQSVDEYGWPTPGAIRYGLERLGITLPYDGLSHNAIEQATYKAQVESRRWAMSDLAADGILPPGRDATDAEVRRYETQVEGRAGHYRNGLNALHLIGTVLLPFSISTGSGDTEAGKAYYAALDRWEEAHPNATQDELYAFKDNYARANPEAWPYLVGTHEGYRVKKGDEFDMAKYLATATLSPDDYVEKAMEAYSYVEAEGSGRGPDTTTPEEEAAAAKAFADLPRRTQMRYQANWATDLNTKVGDTRYALYVGQAELKPSELAALNFPQFDGRQKLLKTVAKIYKAYDQQYQSDDSQAQKDRIIAMRDEALDRAVAPYGAKGRETLRLVTGSPADRLYNAGYFESRSSGYIISESARIVRMAEQAGVSPQGAAETGGVLEAKIALYRRLQNLRNTDPQFDREMRRVELSLGTKTPLASAVHAYEYIFFGQSVNFFGYQDDIVRGLK